MGYQFLNKKLPHGSVFPAFVTIDAPRDPPHQGDNGLAIIATKLLCTEILEKVH